MATLQTFSWLRTYHSGLNPAGVTDDGIARTLPPKAEPVDSAALGFFDIHAVRGRHVVRFKLPGLRLRDHSDGTPIEVPGAAHFLFHASGFLVLRLTFACAEKGIGAADPCAQSWKVDFWSIESRKLWVIPGIDGEHELSVRSAFNLIFLDFYERFRGRRRSTAWLLAKAEESGLGVNHLHGLAQDAREPMGFPFPVSFGAHIELEGTAGDPDQDAIQALLCDNPSAEQVSPVLHHGLDYWWAVRENTSVVCKSYGSVGVLDSVAPDAIQMVEYLNLRLAALWSVQRETQRMLVERSAFSHRQVGEWRRLVSTTTDDWSLHTHMGSLMRTLEQCLSEDSSVRDMNALQAQVAENLEVFQDRLDAAGERAGIVLGVLLGVLAAVSVTPILKTLFSSGQDPDLFTREHWQLSIGIDIAAVFLVGLVGMIWLRRASNWVHVSGQARPKAGRWHG